MTSIAQQQAKCAGLALAIGHEEGLSGYSLELFVNFMPERFPKLAEAQDGRYLREWALRFKKGAEFSYSDNISVRTLLLLQQGMSRQDRP